LDIDGKILTPVEDLRVLGIGLIFFLICLLMYLIGWREVWVLGGAYPRWGGGLGVMVDLICGALTICFRLLTYRPSTLGLNL